MTRWPILLRRIMLEHCKPEKLRGHSVLKGPSRVCFPYRLIQKQTVSTPPLNCRPAVDPILAVHPAFAPLSKPTLELGGTVGTMRSTP